MARPCSVYTLPDVRFRVRPFQVFDLSRTHVIQDSADPFHITPEGRLYQGQHIELVRTNRSQN